MHESSKRYIWEHEAWPEFSWNYERLAPILTALRGQQGRLLGSMRAVGFAGENEATLRNLTAEVVETSAIEGESLAPPQVRSSIARRLGMQVAGLVPSDRSADGVVEMLLDATQLHAHALTQARLFAWHAALFPKPATGGQVPMRIGAWRTDGTGPMQVVSGPIGKEKVHYQAPPARRVSREIKRFLAWLNGTQSLDAVLKAAIAHLWFVTIHPFDDGNGRIARAIADLLLCRSEHTAQRFYSMSAQINAERNAYYNVLEHTQKGTLDITRWLMWFLECMARAIATADATLANVLLKAQFWQRHAGQGFNDRQAKVLSRMLEGFEGKLTSSKWAKICKCSQDTAHRDIADLISRRVLVKNQAGGRSTSYALALPE